MGAPSLIEDTIFQDTNNSTKPQIQQSSLSHQPALVEDFIRNFLIRHEMKETLDVFQHEWYKLNYGGNNMPKEYVPDIFQQKEKLEDKIIQLQKDLDYHRMHHRRVVIEKNELHKKLKRITKHAESYQPVFKEMKTKYEKALKEKTLARMETDKMKTQLHLLTTQFKESYCYF